MVSFLFCAASSSFVGKRKQEQDDMNALVVTTCQVVTPQRLPEYWVVEQWVQLLRLAGLLQQ